MELRGIPKNDTREDTNENVMQLAQKVGVDLKKEDICIIKPPSPDKGKCERRKSKVPTSNYCKVYEPGCSRAIFSSQEGPQGCDLTLDIMRRTKSLLMKVSLRGTRNSSRIVFKSRKTKASILMD